MQTQAPRLLQGEGHPLHRLLMPWLHRFSSVQEREAQEACREQGKVCPAGPADVGSPARH